eukprot:gene6502-4684_t
MSKKSKPAGGENIRVVIRCRDLLPYEAERGDKALTKLDIATNQVVVQHHIGDPDIFPFDAVYNNSSTQRDIFLQEMWGMMPQVVDYIFNEIKKMTSATKTFKVKVSYVELYNGKSRDLLAKKQVNLEIKQNAAKNFYVKGAEMPEVTSFQEAIKHFNAGTERRQTASTDLNDTSSRSHSLFTVQIEQSDFEQDPSVPVIMTSKINVVDLAGSERQSKTNATGDTAVEGRNINLSLSALATVINTIVKGGQHIPLPRGNAKTVMFANIGPSDKNTSETVSTLRFAMRVKQIENKPIKNIDPKDQRIQNLLDQIEELTARLGNVDLNVEDDLRQRIEELEIENSELKGGANQGNSEELEEQVRTLQGELSDKDKELQERLKELSKEVEKRELEESNHAFDLRRLNDLRAIAIEFIQRIYSDEQMAELNSRVPSDGSFNKEADKWDTKEVGFYFNSFIDLYEHWRKVTFTQEDMEKYGQRASEEVREQAQRQLEEMARERDELLRQRDAEAAKRAAENEAVSQLKVRLTALQEDNTRLRQKIERDQEKIKAKLNKSKEEQKTLQDQIEALRSTVDEKDRDIERVKRLLEEQSSQAVASGGAMAAAFNGTPDERANALLKQLEVERNEKQKLENRIKETNVSLRRYGVCITVPENLRASSDLSDAAKVANSSEAFVLAAADETNIDGDAFAQLQQQIRIKQRLTELEHQHHMRLEDMIRRYELLKTGKVAEALVSPGVDTATAPAVNDEAIAMQVKELLQAKEQEIEELRLEKEQTCDKLLEATLEEERAQAGEDHVELMKENTELHAYNQQLAVELETVRGQLNVAVEKLELEKQSKEGEVEYLKDQIQKLVARIDETRGATAEFEEMRKSYSRLQQQVLRSEQALSEKTESLESNRQMVKWSNALLEQEKKKSDELERHIQALELELRQQEEVFKEELAEQMNKQVAANNRRLEAQAVQFQELMAEEQAKQHSLHKKIKSAKSAAAKAAQRYDEMILENESIRTKLEELKVTSIKLFREKQEAERDFDTFRATVGSTHYGYHFSMHVGREACDASEAPLAYIYIYFWPFCLVAAGYTHIHNNNSNRNSSNNKISRTYYFVRLLFLLLFVFRIESCVPSSTVPKVHHDLHDVVGHWLHSLAVPQPSAVHSLPHYIGMRPPLPTSPAHWALFTLKICSSFSRSYTLQQHHHHNTDNRETTPKLSDDIIRDQSSSPLDFRDAPLCGVASPIENFLDRRKACDLKQAAVHEVLEDLWGDEEPYEPTPQDTAGVYSRFMYSWIYKSVITATAEKLSNESLPRQEKYMKVYASGKRLSLALQRAAYDRSVWNTLLGCEVTSRLDRESRGTLRWVGVPQQGKFDRMMAGVEWRVPPRVREAERSGGAPKDPFFDGVAYGEHLFEPATRSMSTLEFPETIIFTAPDDCVLPMPPVPKTLGLMRLLITTLYENFLFQAPYMTVGLIGRLSSPYVLQQYVKYLESSDKTWLVGIGLVAVVFLSSAVTSVAQHRNIFFCLQAGSQFRSALTTSIFEKCFTVSVKALAHPDMHAGRIINMLSTDVEHAYYFFLHLDDFVSIPVTLIVAMAMLCNLVGHSALWGVLAMVFSGIMNAFVMKRSVVLEEKLSSARDVRIKATNEFLSGIRVTKFMAWEHRFVNEIQKRRDVELSLIRRVQLYDCISAFLGDASPSIMLALVLIMYNMNGNTLTPGVVFPTIALVNVLSGPFRFLPWVVTDTLRFLISIKRLRRFFEAEDAPHASVKDIKERATSLAPEQLNGELPAVIFESADLTAYVAEKIPSVLESRTSSLRRLLRFFLRCPGCRPARARPSLTGTPLAAPDNEAAPQAPQDKKRKKKKKKNREDPDQLHEVQHKVLLHDVNVEMPRGRLTVVIGPTGCGKSTLVQSLLSQLEVSKGRVWATKSIAYVPQQPWIMNATVRENVLFFSEERDELLREALRVSQLETDLGLMANGLETEIGEKGINLSGGQKARVSLARAVYADREMYLLDDPLSALDAHVGEKVVRECILGKLAGRTRVLATHHMHVLKHADHVIALGEHRVVFSGSRESFMETETYRQMLASSSSDQHHKTEAPREMVEEDPDDARSASSSSSDSEAKEEKADAAAGHLMTEEEKAVGSVPMATYFKYFKYCGGMRMAYFILGIFAATEVLRMASTVWLSLWSTDSYGLPVSTYLTWYVVFIIAGAFSLPLRFLSSFTIMREGSRNLHNGMLRSVSCATMEFFDTTPQGRLLNRFSRDIDVTDGQLISAMIGFLECVCGMLSSMCIMLISSPWMLIVFFPAGYVYYRILLIYNAANREIRRFSSNIKSPLFSIIGEVTNGVATIAAYGTATIMMQRAIRQLELISSATLLEVVTNRWLAVRVEVGAATLIATLAFSGVFITIRQNTSANIAIMSLALTISMEITTLLNWVVRHVATVEADMNSVERLLHYIENIPHEEMPDLDRDLEALRAQPAPHGKTAAIITDAVAVEPDTPRAGAAGSLEFRNVQMRDVTFCIAPREKVGVVGRTGSGKSTLMLTFMRMVDICGGEILVNGSGIRTYPLRELRKQFSMIPQDPVLFDGTVRQNLDPFQESSAEERVESETGGLDGRVLEGGSNFSVGQRQLLCMARALLRKGSGFILMDEATANIDPTLDRYIQSTVMNAFAEYTVITIAHRLHTVANYDKIIVMDQGVVAETGTPRELVSNRQSIFRGMVEALGPTGVAEFTNLMK